MLVSLLDLRVYKKSIKLPQTPPKTIYSILNHYQLNSQTITTHPSTSKTTQNAPPHPPPPPNPPHQPRSLNSRHPAPEPPTRPLLLGPRLRRMLRRQRGRCRELELCFSFSRPDFRCGFQEGLRCGRAGGLLLYFAFGEFFFLVLRGREREGEGLC